MTTRPRKRTTAPTKPVAEKPETEVKEEVETEKTTELKTVDEPEEKAEEKPTRRPRATPPSASDSTELIPAKIEGVTPEVKPLSSLPNPAEDEPKTGLPQDVEPELEDKAVEADSLAPATSLPGRQLQDVQFLQESMASVRKGLQTLARSLEVVTADLQAIARVVEQQSGEIIVHGCPRADSNLTPCCGRPSSVIPIDEPIKMDPNLVTCRGFYR